MDSAGATTTDDGNAMNKLEGQVALVAGSVRGIGAAIAERLAVARITSGAILASRSYCCKRLVP